MISTLEHKEVTSKAELMHVLNLAKEGSYSDILITLKGTKAAWLIRAAKHGDYHFNKERVRFLKRATGRLRRCKAEVFKGE